MLNYKYRENQVISIDEPLRDYSFYEKVSGSKYNRRCIDGHITGCGNCVGYCQYGGHSGFLTEEQRKEHDCIGKHCFDYLPKVKQEKLLKDRDIQPREIVGIATDLISKFEGMRIINADRCQSGGWIVKYITISNEYSIEAIENKISTIVGEKITMVNLKCDFDRAVQLISAI